jgi:protein-S-isoprenylcysteine O-methyltransferase Ste14
MNTLLTVAIQLLAIVYIASTGPLVPSGNTLLHALFLAGLVLIAAAVWVMREAQWSVTPDVAPKAKLVTWGPYALIRHPMYLGLFLVVGSMVAYAPSADRLIALTILIADLFYKITVEEIALAKKFPSYKSYMKGTKRFIPYLI